MSNDLDSLLNAAHDVVLEVLEFACKQGWGSAEIVSNFPSLAHLDEVRKTIETAEVRMSSQSMRAEQVRFETCQNCVRWHKWDNDPDVYGRCGKFTQRNVLTRGYDTCENFKAKKGVTNE